MSVTFEETFRRLEAGLKTVSWLVALTAMSFIVVDVLLRFLFNHPLPATWEISEILMPYIVFLAFASALNQQAHIRVTLLLSQLTPKWEIRCDVFNNFVGLSTSALITYASLIRFWNSFLIREEILAAVSVPWWVGKFAMPLGMSMFAMRYLLLLITNVRKLCRA